MLKCKPQWYKINFLVFLMTALIWNSTPLPAATEKLHLHLPNPFGSLLPSPLATNQTINLDSTNFDEQVTYAKTKPMDLNKAYFKSVVSDIGYTFKAPFHWKSSDWIKAAVLAGITTIIYNNDDGMMRWIQRNHTDTTDDIAKVAEYMGNYMIVIPGLVLLYSYGGIFKDAKAREAAVLATKCAFISAVVVHLIKGLGGRERPTGDGLGSSTIWNGPTIKVGNSAFPSGHSAAAFSIATAMSMQYKKKWFTILAYTGATLTALSRIHDRKHWASDVFVGSLLGYFISKSIMSRKHKKDKGLAKRIQLLPMMGKDSYGISMYVSF
jgi:membrane-associated phospholipid phosphatase